jgi:hypothetical protein
MSQIFANETLPPLDIVDAAVGIAPGSRLDSLRRAREEALAQAGQLRSLVRPRGFRAACGDRTLRRRRARRRDLRIDGARCALSQALGRA